MAILTTAPDFQVARFPVRRFSVDEYHRMIESGILNQEDPVELLQGWIVPKMSRKPPHDAILDIANELVRGQLPEGWRLRVRSAITTVDSQPEPDLAVVRGPANRYLTRHPSPKEVALVIEISESFLEKDRNQKDPVYAAAGIPRYWIINLVDQVVEVYSEPGARGNGFVFQKMEAKRGSDEVTLMIDGAEVGRLSVRDILGLAGS
jgi:Uma2 family endonuclease